jgi:hypothetical protein
MRKIPITADRRIKLDLLKELKSKLRVSGQNFADSLLRQSRTGLSEKQWESVGKLILAAEDAKATNFTPIEKLQTFATAMRLEGIHKVFEKAKAASVSTPKIKFELADGDSTHTIQLASHKNGNVYVNIERDKKNLPGWKEWKTLGHVDSRGYWVINRHDRDLVIPEPLFPAINELIDNPSKFGSIYGRRLKYCIFCARELTAEDSLYYGYGPICADKYGLEWGEAHTRKQEDAVEELQQFRTEEVVTKNFKSELISDSKPWYLR